MRTIGTGLLTTCHASGTLQACPLQTLRGTRDALWFLIDRGSTLSEELREDFRVSVGYADILGTTTPPSAEWGGRTATLLWLAICGGWLT